MNRRRLWTLSLSFWTAVGLVCGVQIWISMIDHGHQLWRVLVYEVLTWNAWLALSLVIGWLSRRVTLVPPTARAVFAHAVAALAIAPIHSAWWALLQVSIRPYDAMGAQQFAQAYPSIVFSALPLQLCFYCGVLAAHYAIEYYDKYRDRERLAARLEVSLSEARLHALELQIQPHFLFNTLNSISALVRTARQREAVTMIAGLSDLLRYSLDHAGEQRVALGQELAVIERYLAIERLRFPDRVEFEIDAAAEVRRAHVPALVLQPLVENAIRHGIAPLAAPGRVVVRAWRDGARLRLEVFNTGRLAESYRAGVGLRNTADRLRHLYRAEHEFALRGTDAGVVAQLALPWSEAG
jgi:hypothetical protein